MLRWPMLMRRGNTFYSRVQVPLRLQPLFGKKEVLKSLRTVDPEEAKLLSLKVAAELKKVFAALDKKLKTPDPVTVARDYQHKTLADDAAWRQRADLSDDEVEAEASALTDALERLVDDPTAISRLLDRVLMEQGLHVPASQRPLFARELLRSEQETLRILLARTDGKVEEVGPTVTELLEKYLTDRQLGSKGEADVRACIARLVAIIGDKRACEVSKADVRTYREKLFALKLAPATTKKALTMISTLFRFGVEQGLCQSNPLSDGLTRVTRKADQTLGRLPYTSEQIVTLLTAASKLEGARRWLPWLAAFTGARVEELGGLRVQDVRQEQGVWCLDIQPTADRRLKTRGSARKIPLHSRLICEGFLEYVKTVPPDGRLFPELRADKHGVFTSRFGKWYGLFSDKCGITDKRHVFHSYRHSWIDAARRAKVEPEIRSALLGHSTASGTMTARYGSGHDLKALQEAVNAVRYGVEVPA